MRNMGDENHFPVDMGLYLIYKLLVIVGYYLNYTEMPLSPFANNLLKIYVRQRIPNPSQPLTETSSQLLGFS